MQRWIEITNDHIPDSIVIASGHVAKSVGRDL
jgi:hypothetical protein